MSRKEKWEQDERVRRFLALPPQFQESGEKAEEYFKRKTAEHKYVRKSPTKTRKS